MKRLFYFSFSVFLLLHSAALIGQKADSWTDYRGPSYNGQSSSKDVPLNWSDNNNLKWKADIPGQGWSSPVLLNNQIWITSAKKDGLELFALCFDLSSGKLIHNTLVFRKDSVQKQHPLNSFASPSPAVEEGYFYVHFGAYGTACLNTLSGKVVWKREDIYCDHEVGPGSSPIIYKNLLIFHMDGVDVRYVIALDKKTGKTIWKTDRNIDVSALRFDEKKAFYTPIIKKIDGQDQLISPGPHAVMGYKPLTGEQIWIIHYKGFSGSSRPLVAENKLFINTGHGPSAMVAMKLGGKGDLTTTNFLWENRKSMQARSSQLYIGGYIYLINVGGQAKCIDPDTGEVLWTEKVGQATSASPFYAEGRIYTFDEDGLCTIFKPGKVFQKISENRLSAGCMASPFPIDGGIIIRTKDSLIRIGK